MTDPAFADIVEPSVLADRRARRAARSLGEALADERRADAVDTDPKVQAAAEKAAQTGRQEALGAAADQAQANADALKAAAKAGK